MIKMKIIDKIELDNKEQGKKYVYYAKRNGNTHEIVMCIENEDGYRPVQSAFCINLNEEEAQNLAYTMNSNMGMADKKENAMIVASTMTARNT